MLTSRFEIFEPPLFWRQIRMRTSAKLPLRTRTNSHEVGLMALQSNFAKLHAKGLRNFLSVGANGPNLIVNKLKSYKNIDDGSVTSHMENGEES